MDQGCLAVLGGVGPVFLGRGIGKTLDAQLGSVGECHGRERPERCKTEPRQTAADRSFGFVLSEFKGFHNRYKLGGALGPLPPGASVLRRYHPAKPLGTAHGS